MATPLTLDLYVNGDLTTVTVADETEPLLYVLRNQVGIVKAQSRRSFLATLEKSRFHTA
jgi:hypothetical protein